MKKFAAVFVVAILALTLIAAPVFAGGGPPPFDADGNRVRPMVYVTNQGLIYPSIVGPALPMEGPFQLLETGVGPTGLQTEFGPGDPGYVGGRWWVDGDGDGVMDEPDGSATSDAYFSCPLLGKGKAYEPPA
jgi:hypothetical protein